MALMTTAPSSHSGESHSPSPDPDLQVSPDMESTSSNHNASPLSLPSSLNAGQDDHERDQRSSRSTPTRSSPTDLSRSRSAGRGGCWTCRVRRKKCDEERVDGDSCRTCKRLGIKCLGWGPRRPDWMRDKDRVAQYKADIKAQLTRAGLIRGQPRAMYTSLTGSGTSSANSGSRAGPGDSFPQAAAAGPGPSTHTIRSRRSDSYSLYPHASGYDSSSQYPRPSSMMSAIPGLDSVAANGNADMAMAPSPFVVNTSYTSGMYGNDVHTMPNMSPYHASAFLPAESIRTLSLSPVNALRASPLNEPTEQLVQYYFDNVRKMQFAFAGPELTQSLWNILQRDPRGPLEHAICALASLHSTKLYDTATEAAGERPLHKRFFDQGHNLLQSRRAAGTRQFPEDDAVAAVFLIGYYMMVGGGINWLHLLEVAYEWFSQTGIVEEQNPKLMLLNLSDVQRLAVKATMWIDILAGVVFVKQPRYLPVYRRLLGAGGGGFWASTTNDRLDLRMDKLTGCPDEAVLALAETATLAYWKHAELQRGSLSVRDLIRRGDLIEQSLRQGALRSLNSSPVTETGPLLPSGLCAPAGMFPNFNLPAADDASRSAIPQIWKETAVLYLHTVLSDSHPGVPEIAKSVTQLMEWYHNLAASDLDRSVVFPLVLTACLTDDPYAHELLKQRMAVHVDDARFNGPMAQAGTLVDYVWQRRAGRRIDLAVDWRECMRERWSSLVMV